MEKEEIKKETKQRDSYSVECSRCHKIIRGVSIKQLNHNFSQHKMFCKKEKGK